MQPKYIHLAQIFYPYSNYCISNSGDVYKIKTDGTINIKKSTINNRGYKLINLWDLGGNKKSFSIHRLVLMVFSGEPKDKTKNIARHLNDDKLDNRIENLAWGSSKDNCSDAIKNNKNAKGEKHGSSKLSEKDVLDIRRDIENNLKQFEIANKYNISQSLVSLIKNKKNWKYL